MVHTFQPPSISKREVCNEASKSRRQYHGAHRREDFEFWALWKPEKGTLQDLLLSHVIPGWILHCLRENFPGYPRGIIVNNNSHNFNNSAFLGLKITNCIDSQTSFASNKKILLMIRWLPRATHKPNFVISSQYFHIGFVKIVIDLKIS